MYALIAHKGIHTRNVENGEPVVTHFLGIEKRSMGCFNGMNTENAFSARMAQFEAIYFVDANGRVRSGNSCHNYTTSEGTTAFNAACQNMQLTPGQIQWSCLGLGYLAYVVATNFGKSYGQLANQFNTGHKMDSIICTMLNRDGFNERFNDPNSGETVITIRELTPNEQFLSNWYGSLKDRASRMLSNEREAFDKQSGPNLAVHLEYIYGGGFIQFVGSERPSGLAVSYLQAWRNTSEINSQYGWKEGNEAARTILKAAYENNPNYRGNARSTMRSFIGIMSYFTNYGSDSDIITFAGDYFVQMVTRWGIFGMAQFYRDERPMTVEGRYNKGGQSDYINQQVQAFLTRLRFEAPARTVMQNIQTMKSAGAELGNAHSALSQGYLSSLVRSYGPGAMHEINRKIEAYRAAAQRYAAVEPRTTVAALFRQAESFPAPTATPAAPAQPTGPATSFHQWVASAETVH